MKEFVVTKANIGAEQKPPIDIAVEFLGIDTRKGYLGPFYSYDKEAYIYLGVSRPDPTQRRKD